MRRQLWLRAAGLPRIQADSEVGGQTPSKVCIEAILDQRGGYSTFRV